VPIQSAYSISIPSIDWWLGLRTRTICSWIVPSAAMTIAPSQVNATSLAASTKASADSEMTRQRFTGHLFAPSGSV
jgi:hypothetical protein